MGRRINILVAFHVTEDIGVLRILLLTIRSDHVSILQAVYGIIMTAT